MHSRAFLLLRRDLVTLQKEPIPGISAGPSRDASLFHWSAKLEGLRGTVWEGGVFQVAMAFNEDFNTRPPQVHFVTIPFHPNVDPSNGRPSLPILERGWSEECGVATVLLALQAMLGDPELAGECVRNSAAARLLREAPHTYRQMALDCVTASLRIDAGLTPYELDDEDQQSSPEHRKITRTPSLTPHNEPRPHRAPKAVSFDDYHALWRGIATSVTAYQQPSSFSQLLLRDGPLSAVHCSDREHKAKEETFQQNLQDLSRLKYGKVRPLPKLEPRMRQQRIEELRLMYREGGAATTAPGMTDSGSAESVQNGARPRTQATEVDGGDIDELVDWVQTLDENQLEP